MANPNIVNVTAIYGKTTGANLTSTGAAIVLNNASGSNTVLKVNTFNVSNYTASAANITVNFNNSANLGGTNFSIVSTVSVPGNSTLNVIDKSSQYYLEENQSLGATAGTANALHITCSYESIN
jgi:hypothetical protein